MNLFALDVIKDRKKLFISVLFLVLLVTGLRLNVLMEPFGTDQGIFSYVGMCMNRGDIVYTDVQDHKPPLIFYMYQLLTRIQLPVKLTLFAFDTVFLLLFACMLGLFMERYILKKSFLPAAALFAFLISTESLYEGGGQTELYMIFFQFLFYIGLWRYLKESIYRPLELFASGAALAVAGLWKPVALIAIVPAGMMLLYQLIYSPPQKRKLLPFVYLIAGFCVPHIIVILYFLHLGNLQAYVFTSYLFDIVLKQRYPSETSSFLMNFLIFIKEQVIALAFVWASFMFFIIEQFKRTKLFTPYISAISFWGILLTFDIIAACSGGRFFGHYFIQPLVSATILLTIIFSVFLKERTGYMKIIGILLIAAFGLQVLKITAAPVRNPVDTRKVIGEYLKARSGPEDTIYVNGVRTGINYFAERKAPWKYVHDIFIRVADKKTMEQECRTMLEKRPKFIVITNPDWVFAPVQEALRTSYRKTAVILDTPIYVRR